jgi:hypothetical protein
VICVAAPSIFADQKVNRIVHQTVIRADLQKEDISTPSIREIKDMRRLSAIASRRTTQQGLFSHVLRAFTR